MILVAVCLALVMFMAGCGKVKEEEAYIYGMESWVYGYPMVMMEVTREVLTAAPAPNSEGTAAPINQLAKMPHYVSPDFKNVVRISLNSLWTTGWVDLEKEPIVLSVPDTHDRYYVFSLMNMWTDVFGSIGKRTTGTGPGSFLIVGPNWKGAAPSDIKQTFRSPTRYAWLLGQTQVNGPDDFAAVNALQAEYKLTPLSAWGKPYTPPDNVPVDQKVDLKVTPPDQVARMDAGTFFNRLALAMKDNPPYAEDKPAIEKLKKLGIEPGKPFDIAKVDPKIAAGLAKAVKEVQIKMAEEVTKIKNVNGWMQPHNLGRYGTDYNTRAGIAYLGLGADMQEDTVYPTAYVDGDGNSLDSANKYVMHYEKDQLPPTNATWSVSQYKGNFYERMFSTAMPSPRGCRLSTTRTARLTSTCRPSRRARTRSPTGCPLRRASSTLQFATTGRRKRRSNGTYKNPPVRKVQ